MKYHVCLRHVHTGKWLDKFLFVVIAAIFTLLPACSAYYSSDIYFSAVAENGWRFAYGNDRAARFLCRNKYVQYNATDVVSRQTSRAIFGVAYDDKKKELVNNENKKLHIDLIYYGDKQDCDIDDIKVGDFLPVHTKVRGKSDTTLSCTYVFDNKMGDFDSFTMYFSRLFRGCHPTPLKAKKVSRHVYRYSP